MWLRLQSASQINGGELVGLVAIVPLNARGAIVRDSENMVDESLLCKVEMRWLGEILSMIFEFLTCL